MKIKSAYLRQMFALFITSSIISCSPEQQTQALVTDANDDIQAAALLLQIEELEQSLTRVKGTNEIKRLQRTYGYYIDRSEWDNVVDLLTDDATAEYGNAGVYVGKESVRALLYGVGYGEKGLQPQQLREHIQLQPVITIAADGNTAKGRWRGLVLLGQYEEYARWQEGPYENEYRKEDGVWKISKLYWMENFTVPFEGGWSTVMAQSNVADRDFPEADLPPTLFREPWPAVNLMPYHYSNPVSDRATEGE